MADVHVFVEWMCRQGHSVLESKTSCWVGSGARTYQAIPYQGLISPDESEIRELLFCRQALAIRYSAPLDSAQGRLGYHVVYEQGEYSQKNLPKKARHDVKRGLSAAVIEPIPLARMASEGWVLRYDTLVRQGRTDAETETWWKLLCESAQDLEGFEAWGAMVDGKLAAALLSFHCDDYYCILYQQSLTDYLRFGVNNALAYVVTAEVLLRPGVRSVFYGLSSLDAPATVDEFKFRMGYTAKPVRQRVVFHPYFRPFVNPVSHGLLNLSRRVLPGSYVLSKAEGMFRFYLEGNLPLEQQPVPEVLKVQTVEAG